jgi:murein DD-endopeptidase MepM/ murein hydrolase activator NlpD
MNTKISLSFLVITGALLSAESTYAETSVLYAQSLVVNDTLGTQVSGANHPTNPGIIDREAAQINDNSPTFGNNVSSFGRNDLSNRTKNRAESEIGTANLGERVGHDPVRVDRDRQQSVFESDELNHDLAPPESGEKIVGANRINDHQQSRFDRADLARRNLSVPNLSSPKSADLARRNLSVPNLSPPKSAESADSVRRNLSIPDLSPPKSDNLSISDNQTNVFSSDVAVRGNTSKPHANPPTTEQPEVSIAIPVPPPRTRQTTKIHPVTPIPKVASKPAPKVAKSGFAKVGTHQASVFTSDVAVIDRSNKIIDRSNKIFDRSTKVSPSLLAEQSEVSIAIPVSAPRTQKMIKVPSVTRIPEVAKIKSIAPVVSVTPMGQEGYATPVAKIKSTAPVVSAIPMGQAGYAIPVANPKSIAPIVPAIPMGQGGYGTARSTPIPTNDRGMTDSNSVAIYPLLNPAPVTSKFGWRTHPLTGKRRFHSGVDIGAPMGAPVVATGSGTVVSAGWKGGYGKTIVIEHNGVQQTLYGHLSEISVQSGQTIAQGTVIGLVGSTGNSTGPHLHFETRTSNSDGWVAVDPIEEVNYAMDSLQRSMPYVRRDSQPGL